MTYPVTRLLIAIAAMLLLSAGVFAQNNTETAKKPKPYRVLTSGKQVTIKSSKSIKNIMVWTASGHRIVEQKDINVASYSFNTITKEKIFFLMIQYEGQKPFTEKIGVD